MNTEQRPKIEDFEDYVFLVLKALYMEDAQLQTEQVCVILGKNFVIFFEVLTAFGMANNCKLCNIGNLRSSNFTCVGSLFELRNILRSQS